MLLQKISKFQTLTNAISSLLGIKLSTKECVFYSRKCTFHSGSDYQPHNLQAMNKDTFEWEQILLKPPKKRVKNWLKYSICITQNQ